MYCESSDSPNQNTQFGLAPSQLRLAWSIAVQSSKQSLNIRYMSTSFITIQKQPQSTLCGDVFLVRYPVFPYKSLSLQQYPPTTARRKGISPTTADGFSLKTPHRCIECGLYLRSLNLAASPLIHRHKYGT
jgi:hypothetical protein